jgi:hypothetical protein
LRHNVDQSTIATSQPGVLVAQTAHLLREISLKNMLRVLLPCVLTVDGEATNRKLRYAAGKEHFLFNHVNRFIRAFPQIGMSSNRRPGA